MSEKLNTSRRRATTSTAPCYWEMRRRPPRCRSGCAWANHLRSEAMSDAETPSFAPAGASGLWSFLLLPLAPPRSARALLHDVRQLVRDEVLALLRPRLVAAGGEEHVVASGER